MAYSSSVVKRARSRSPTPAPNKLPRLASGSASSPILINNALEKEGSGVATAISLTYEEFKNLDDAAQMKQYMDMREALLKLEYCPSLDIELFRLRPTESRLNEEEEKDTDHQLRDLRAKWSLWVYTQRIHRLPDSANNTWTHWYDDDLYWNAVESRFELCQRCSHYLSFEDVNDLLRHKSLHGLWPRMSSQLLLYRLTIYMERSPNLETDAYKTCWETKFQHSDKFSILRFWDSKGAPRMEFRGTRNCQDDALQLVNLLAGLKFPHTYDGVIAGTVA
ncbi:hypothetical protein BDV12DRAFT_196548 [Aspergillus spectabilis]